MPVEADQSAGRDRLSEETKGRLKLVAVVYLRIANDCYCLKQSFSQDF